MATATSLRLPARVLSGEALCQQLLAEHHGPWPDDACDQDYDATHHEDHDSCQGQWWRSRVDHAHRGWV
jgi:hypothetical protein